MTPMQSGINAFKSVLVSSIEAGLLAGTVNGCVFGDANSVLASGVLGSIAGAAINLFQNNNIDIVSINGFASGMFSYTISILAKEMYSNTSYGRLAGLSLICLSSTACGVYAVKKHGFKVEFKDIVRFTTANIIIHSGIRVFQMIEGR